MAKDKKAKKARKGDEIEALKPKKARKADGADKKSKKNEAARPHPLEALSRLADHPLVSELLAAGALAAVAAVAEAGAKEPARGEVRRQREKGWQGRGRGHRRPAAEGVQLRQESGRGR
jgi:hypothetical protein